MLTHWPYLLYVTFSIMKPHAGTNVYADRDRVIPTRVLARLDSNNCLSARDITCLYGIDLKYREARYAIYRYDSGRDYKTRPTLKEGI